MFLKGNVFKKMMKNAWKNGNLYLAAEEDRVIITSSWWVCEILKQHIPNGILGAAYELAGEMPEVGEIFKSSAEGNQYELELPVSIKEIREKKGKLLAITSVILDGMNQSKSRVLQDTESWEISLVDEAVVSMIYLKQINREAGETAPQGPFVTNNAAYWENNVMKFGCLQSGDRKNREIVKLLEKVDLEGMVAE